MFIETETELNFKLRKWTEKHKIVIYSIFVKLELMHGAFTDSLYVKEIPNWAFNSFMNTFTAKCKINATTDNW